MRRLASVLGLLLAAIGGFACTSTQTVDAPTQIMLRIGSTDAALIAELTQLRVSVSLHEGSVWKSPVSTKVDAGALRWPVDIPVTPRSTADASKEFEVVVEALADGSVLAQTRAVTSFVPNKRLVLELSLYLCAGHDPGFVCADADPACRGEACTLCSPEGTCVPVEPTDPETLSPLLPGVAGHGGMDAGEQDASPGSEGGSEDAEQRDAEAEPDAIAEDGSAEAGELSPPAEYALGEPSQPCTPEQEQTLACEGHASRKVLKCQQGSWQVLQTCAQSERCDSRVGTEQGTCAAIPAACVGRMAGDVCDGLVRVTCGLDLVDVSSHACSAHARCSDDQGAARCACEPGYHDDGAGTCINPDDCPAGACEHGSCVDGLDDFSCNCPAGYAGTGTKLCTRVNYCPKDACTPGGTCIDESAWSCQCSAGFAGSGTQACSNIDDCPATSCRPPGGTCQDGVNTHSCSCSPGFSGLDCVNDVCTPNPCKNGGSCARSGTLCACPAGFSGTNCQVDACSPNPCANGGTCSRTAQGASCACALGYQGSRCEAQVTSCGANNLCTSPSYPCVIANGSGYSCLGQFAEWHVPGALAGAKFAPSYDRNSAGVVRDNVTGLIWQDSVDAGTVTWDAAKLYCDTLTHAGASDWRLPSKIELASIVDETKYSPSIDPLAFPNTPATGFWTSSPSVSPSGNPWNVNFSNGRTTNFTASSFAFNVRCVRAGSAPAGSTPANRYTVNTASDTVTDTRTTLVWQRTASATTLAWEAAKSACSSGWRLPTLNELLTLVDPTRGSPTIDPTFPNTPGESFWTASPYIDTPGNAWYVSFALGISDRAPATTAFRIRCVR